MKMFRPAWRQPHDLCRHDVKLHLDALNYRACINDSESRFSPVWARPQALAAECF